MDAEMGVYVDVDVDVDEDEDDDEEDWIRGGDVSRGSVLILYVDMCTCVPTYVDEIADP